MDSIPPGAVCSVCQERPVVAVLFAPDRGCTAGYCAVDRQRLIDKLAELQLAWFARNVDPGIARAVLVAMNAAYDDRACLRSVPGKSTWEDAAHYRKAVTEELQWLYSRGERLTAPALAERFRGSGNVKLQGCDDRRIRDWAAKFGVHVQDIAREIEGGAI